MAALFQQQQPFLAANLAPRLTAVAAAVGLRPSALALPGSLALYVVASQLSLVWIGLVSRNLETRHRHLLER